MDAPQSARMVLVVVGLSLLGIGTCSAVDGRAATLVIPARQTIVQLAFDIARLRPVELVAYDSSAQSELHMHVWDDLQQDWQRTDMSAYRSGILLGSETARVMVIGSDERRVNELADAAGSAFEVTRIPTLSVVTVVNALNEVMHFTPNEWRWLAARHGLQLKDVNVERRRWGRYGPPSAGTRDLRPLPPREVRERDVAERLTPRAVESWGDDVQDVPAPAPAPTPATAPAGDEPTIPLPSATGVAEPENK